MDSDNDSYFEESSESEEEIAGPIHINVNIEESPESPPPGSPSPAPAPPAPIPVVELSPVWELPDDGTNFLNYFTRTDVLELKNRAVETKARINEKSYVVEAPMVSQSFWAFLSISTFSSGKFNFCSLQPGLCLIKCWPISPVIPGWPVWTKVYWDSILKAVVGSRKSRKITVVDGVRGLPRNW